MCFILYVTWVWNPVTATGIQRRNSPSFLSILPMKTDIWPSLNNSISKTGSMGQNSCHPVSTTRRWLPRTSSISLAIHRHPTESSESITAMTINRLEEQIQMLKVKVEDINARLENVTSILQETHHAGNVPIFSETSSSSMRFFCVLEFTDAVGCVQFQCSTRHCRERSGYVTTQSPTSRRWISLDSLIISISL